MFCYYYDFVVSSWISEWISNILYMYVIVDKCCVCLYVISNQILGSPYKKYIDDAILTLKERGEIQKLKDLWWKEKRGGGKCGVSLNFTLILFIFRW